ncbi:MAG TPA: lysophospholipid acyltransferase family protein [Pirellulales bacterium]|nr:lysophospholipid acyltransferase family protein [Pirellulales bacterium]
MKIRHPAVLGLAGLVASSVVRSWMSTLDYRVAYFDESIDPVKPSYSGRKIYIFWHEFILFPLHLRGHCNMAMLLSRHADAEILSRAAHHMGFTCVRGSTYRGATSAIRAMAEKSEHMNLTITPDGPRGPRRVLAQGPVYLASKLGMPIVPMGFGYDRPWRMPTWDRFALPRPYSRARAVVAPPMHIPQNLDRDGIERYRAQVERVLNRMTLEAEAWAESGTHKIGEQAGVRQHAYHGARRIDKPHVLAGPHQALPAHRIAASPRSAEGAGSL